MGPVRRDARQGRPGVTRRQRGVAALRSRLDADLGGLRGYPGQFWLNFVAVFLFLASSSFVFPYLGLYLRENLGISLTLVGVAQGVSSFAGMSFQILGGFWADRRGRRGVMLLALAASAVLFGALVVAHAVWLAVSLVIAQGALGWPMFLTASNAMVADLVPQDRTAEAYGLLRVAMNAGVIAGPAIAGLALANGADFGDLFLTAAAGCAALFVLLLVRLRETRPAAAAEQALGAAVDPFVGEPRGGHLRSADLLQRPHDPGAAVPSGAPLADARSPAARGHRQRAARRGYRRPSAALPTGRSRAGAPDSRRQRGRRVLRPSRV
jgi:MFS family permease